LPPLTERPDAHEGLGLSEAVNTLARRGIQHKHADFVFTPLVYDVGVKIDVTNVGDALELLDEMDTADTLGEPAAPAR
jgi:hypothetical protein